jgi:hypothetical protein
MELDDLPGACGRPPRYLDDIAEGEVLDASSLPTAPTLGGDHQIPGLKV